MGISSTEYLTLLVILMCTLKTISTSKHCTMSTVKLTCTYDTDEYSTFSVDKSDIKSLDLSNTIITELNRSSLKAYANLEDLNLSHCRIKGIEKGAFADLYKLIKLNLSDNLMTTFEADTFETLNALNVLVLSNNLLENLDSFASDKFPKLIALDVSGNNLKYLPSGVMDRIANNPPFSVYGRRNPWNCNNLNWKRYLDGNRYLSNIFCNNADRLKSMNNNSKDDENDRIFSVKRPTKREACSFLSCKWWIIASVWIGIILGNVNRLNTLLYQSRCRRKKRLVKCVGTEGDPFQQVKQEKLAVSLEEAEKQKIHPKV